MNFNDIHADNNSNFKFMCFFDELKKQIVNNIDLKIVKVYPPYAYTRVHDINLTIDDTFSVITMTYRDCAINGLCTSTDELFIYKSGDSIEWKLPHFSDNDINILEATIINKLTLKYYNTCIIENASIDFIQTLDFGNVPEDILSLFFEKYKFGKYTPKVLKSKYNLISFAEGCNGDRILAKLKQYGIRYIIKHLYFDVREQQRKVDTLDAKEEENKTYFDKRNLTLFKPCWYNAMEGNPCHNFYEFIPQKLTPVEIAKINNCKVTDEDIDAYFSNRV